MKKETIRDLYKFVVAMKRVLLVVYSAIAIVLFAMVLGTGTRDTFFTAVYTTSPIWLGYRICKGAELILKLSITK